MRPVMLLIQDAKESKFDPFNTEFMLLGPNTSPFHAVITPRTAEYAKLIEESYQDLKLA
jgi:hypothetical protein